MWIEIFKTGRHTSSNGSELSFSAEDLDKIASLYNSRVDKDKALIAPLVKGHPKTDEPAQGWVERLSRRGNYLLAKLRDLSPEIIEEVRNKKYQKVSIALTSDLQLKHIGLLGAVSPAVEGLAPVSFADLDEHLEIEYQHDDGTLTHLINKNNELKSKIYEYERELIRKDLLEFTSHLVEKKVIPFNQKNTAKEILELAYDIDRNSNKEYNLLDKLKSFLYKLQFNTLQNEFATNHTSNQFGELSNAKELLEDRDKLHHTILEYIKQNPEVTYQQALTNLIK